ncbi:MAG: alginate export family protein [Rhodocyclales bacterium]|nr:alginate export family protein [Rhodocyclales bacterium]
MKHGNLKRGVSACALIAGYIALAGGVAGQAQAAAVGKKPAVARQPTTESEVLRRLQELEAQVTQYREETGRLRAELAQKQGAVPVAAKVPEGTQRAGAGGTATKPAAAGGDWDEPEVDKKAEGRDDEARRRLLVLETQNRKSAAEIAKREEAQKDKVQFDFSGKYKAQVNSRHNFNLGNPLQQWKYDNNTFVDHRFSLQIDATYEALLTRLVLDKGNFVSDWKEDSEGTMERWGQFRTPSSPLVRELFVQYTSPEFMARVGRQNWDIGQRIVLEGPMDGIRFQYPLGQLPWGQTTLSAGYMAVPGGYSSYATFNATGGRLGGTRQEIFGASNSLDAFYADLDIRASRALRVKPYLLKVIDRGGAGDPDMNLDKDFNAATLPRDGQFRPLWAGVTASAEFGPWKLDGEAVSLTGDYAAGRKLSANALLLKAMRDFGKLGSLANLSAGVQFGRGSGNETSDPANGTVRNYNALFMCPERHKFGNIFSEDIRAGYYVWDSNLSNVTYFRVDTTLEPRPGLKLTPSLTRIWTTKEVFKGRGPVNDWSQGAATSLDKTRDVGWELDLNASFPIYKHVDGFISLGSFKPGAAYALPDGSKPKAAREIVFRAEVKF